MTETTAQYYKTLFNLVLQRDTAVQIPQSECLQLSVARTRDYICTNDYVKLL